jgi:uncharacterized protein YciI
MSDFFVRLNAPRPTFVQDMNDAERQLMQQHALYWHSWMAHGNVLVFGLVADAKGAFGMGVVRFESEVEARRFADNDPTIVANAGFSVDVFAMPFGAVRP